MNIIEVKPILTEEEINNLEGNFLDESFMKYPPINEDTIVKNEKGETLLEITQAFHLLAVDGVL